jgi:hypothetical protein
MPHEHPPVPADGLLAAYNSSRSRPAHTPCPPGAQALERFGPSAPRRRGS